MWDEGGSQPADDCSFLCGSGNTNHLGTDFSYIRESNQLSLEGRG